MRGRPIESRVSWASGFCVERSLAVKREIPYKIAASARELHVPMLDWLW